MKKIVLPIFRTFNREWVALLIFIFIMNLLFLFSEFWQKQYYLFLWLLTRIGGSVGLMIQIMVCAQTSIKLNLIIFLIDVPLAVKLVELMLQGWPSQPTLEKRPFFVGFTCFSQENGKNEFHNCLPHLNFAKRAIFLTLLICNPIFFWAPRPKKQRKRMQDNHSELQIHFWKISLVLCN